MSHWFKEARSTLDLTLNPQLYTRQVSRRLDGGPLDRHADSSPWVINRLILTSIVCFWLSVPGCPRQPHVLSVLFFFHWLIFPSAGGCPLCPSLTSAVQRREGHQGGVGEDRHHRGWQELLEGGAQFTSPVSTQPIQPNQHQDTQFWPTHTQRVILPALCSSRFTNIVPPLNRPRFNTWPLFQIRAGCRWQRSLRVPHGGVDLLSPLSGH